CLDSHRVRRLLQMPDQVGDELLVQSGKVRGSGGPILGEREGTDQLLQHPLTGGAGFHVGFEGKGLGALKFFGHQLPQLCAPRTGVHDGSSLRVSGATRKRVPRRPGSSRQGPSSLASSSRSMCSTLLFALKTVATFSRSCSATTAPESCSSAVRRKASQVCGSTRCCTRVMASSRSSRSNTVS